MTETEVKLKLFEDYERIHGLVFSEEHKQKMMDELDLYSFISKINEYMYFAKKSTVVFLHAREGERKWLIYQKNEKQLYDMTN